MHISKIVWPPNPYFLKHNLYTTYSIIEYIYPLSGPDTAISHKIFCICPRLFFLLVHSEWKNRSKFLTPWNGFFGINYHYWTWGNAFWPFLAPPDPWGGSRGYGGGQGGSRGPKIVTFLGATFGLQIGKFWIVWTENTLFSRFLAKNGPSGEQKWSFLGWNGWTQKCIFLKNTLFKLPENAP